MTVPTPAPSDPTAGTASAAATAGETARPRRSNARADLARLAAEPADLLVIGGGIVGAGIARDAAMRGLRTVLLEQRDLGSGTSSRSSRLIHGGLRYLEEGQFGLVAEATRERAILLQIAPHLVKPLPFLFPVHRGDRVGVAKLAAGMFLYDVLALFRNVRSHQLLGKHGVLEAEPLVRERGLLGGARYYDAQCDDARLVVATARAAQYHGALVANYAAVERLELEQGRVVGVHVHDRITNARALVRAAVVVNATGPWSDRVRALEDPAAPPRLRLTKGTHIVIPRERLGLEGAVTFTSRVDGRVMFALPWGDAAYVGTTDTDTTEGPDQVAPSIDDAIYLLRSANAEFPSAHLTLGDVRAAWAGLRPLVGAGDGTGSGKAGKTTGTGRTPSRVPREHAITTGPGGMITVAGGKLTTYRAMAAEVVNAAVKELRRQDGRRRIPAEARTDLEPLVGGETADFAPFREGGEELGLPNATVEHLLRHYGTETAGIYNLCLRERALLRPLHPEHPAICAEVVHAARRELARTVEDVLVRRIHLYYETADHGLAAIGRVTNLLGRELGWDEAALVDEAEKYRAFVAAAPLG